jgi:hypothetical protein
MKCELLYADWHVFLSYLDWFFVKIHNTENCSLRLRQEVKDSFTSDSMV